MKTENRYICPHCKTMVEPATKPKRSFMGFLRIVCATCNKDFHYPLTTGYVTFYWFLLGANAIFLIYVLLQGGSFIPNPIGLVVITFVIISLFKSTKLKREIEKLENTLPKKK